MTVLLLLSMAWELVGSAFADLCMKLFKIEIDGYAIAPLVHEVLGILLIILFCVHLWLNRYWIKNLFKGRYNASRFVLALFNFLLILDVIFLLISGVIISKSIFIGWFDFMSLALARPLHILASYWGYVIISFHVGLYWNVMSAMMRVKLQNNLWPHVLAVLLMVYGAYAFMKRNLAEYMFLRSQFVFFDFEEPLIYFLLDYIAIMILFAGLGHYLMLLLRKLKI
ncbi:MAG: DUF4405 domain-containing protein [Synergistaceae bacterium]|nr:DUF4405 domain-containing protein [Synergistaceae bacterium]